LVTVDFSWARLRPGRDIGEPAFEEVAERDRAVAGRSTVFDTSLDTCVPRE
jgi:hypothetical protein